MNINLEADGKFWDILDHIDKINGIVASIGNLSPASAALFALLLLIPLLVLWSKVLNKFHVAKSVQKWYFIGFVLIYAAIIFFIKVDTQEKVHFTTLKKRVLHEMVYRLWTRTPIDPLSQALSERPLKFEKLAIKDPDYFHYAMNTQSIPHLSIVNKEILKAIENKKNALGKAIVTQEFVPLDSLKIIAQRANFGIVSDELIREVVAANKKLEFIHTGPLKFVTVKPASGKTITEQPIKAQTEYYNLRMAEQTITRSPINQ